jgi:hypothetical protein
LFGDILGTQNFPRTGPVRESYDQWNDEEAQMSGILFFLMRDDKKRVQFPKLRVYTYYIYPRQQTVSNIILV